MYVVVRSDLPLGTQLAQAVHAAFQFSAEYPSTSLSWHRDSNYLVVLSVPDEEALTSLVSKAVSRDVSLSMVLEPDLDNQLTAVVLEPGDASRRLCGSLPLAMRSEVLC